MEGKAKADGNQIGGIKEGNVYYDMLYCMMNYKLIDEYWPRVGTWRSSGAVGHERPLMPLGLPHLGWLTNL